jgi:uncharacterized protein (DUF1810 family)
MPADDVFNLQRFVAAQEPVFAAVVKELAAGQKRSHWMWFVFPQLRGLGQSSTAQFYGITSLDEAHAYLAHPELGPRLIACTRRVLAIDGRSLNAIFGSPDDMKFRSSMTLFALASRQADNVFCRALQRFCDGTVDDRTTELLGERRLAHPGLEAGSAMD